MVTVVEGVVAAEAVAVVVEVVAEEAVVAGDVDEVSRCGEGRQRLKAKKTHLQMRITTSQNDLELCHGFGEIEIMGCRAPKTPNFDAQ